MVAEMVKKKRRAKLYKIFFKNLHTSAYFSLNYGTTKQKPKM